MRTNVAIRLVSGLSLALLVSGSGCRGSTGTATSAVGIQPTLDFVFSQFTIDADDGSPAAGINVDGLYSTGGAGGCGFADRVSDLDGSENMGGCVGTTCQGGVDNRLPLLVDTIDEALFDNVRARLGTALSAGRMVYLLRLTNVDDLENDPEVTASLYTGFSHDSSCNSLFGGAGHYLVNEASLAVAGNLATPHWSATGSISQHRFSARYGTQAVQAAEAPANFPINQLTVRATLDGSGTSASAGNLGGWMSGESARDVTSDLFPSLLFMLNGVIPQIDDLPDSSGSCGGLWGYPVGGLGIGVRFSLVRAIIDGTTDTAPPGMCGT